MIEGLKPYPEYRESGSKWLGAVPVKWEVHNLRTLISKRAERDRADLPLLSVAREKGVFVRSLTDADENHNVIPDDLSNYKVARVGNLVINKMKAWQGSMGIAPCDGIVSPAYFVFDFRIANHAFGQRLLRSKPYVAHFGQASDGVRVGQWDLSIPGMRQIPVLVPPPDEQAAIVRFLDWANGRLERAIRAKRKVIALLNEQKLAIIHHAVTRGLDPSVPLKPSGIPWLGDIPRHWEVRRLRHLIKGRLTYGANAAAEFTNPDWPRYIRITDFRADGSLKSDTFRSLPPAVASDYMVDAGDILFARSGATVGKAFLVLKLTGDACHAGYLIRARPDCGLVHPEYLFAFTQSKAFSTWKDSTFNTATIQNIGADKYANLPVPLPSLPEQQMILESVTMEQRPLLVGMARLNREIELLREYRTRLVADVVTGKLDVREAAARLPDMPTDTDAEFAAETLDGAGNLEETDPNKLHDLKAALDGAQMYSPEQVQQVVELFLGGAGRDQLDPILDSCVAVYKGALDEDQQVDFKGKAKVFCRTYDFLASVMPYTNPEWERLSILLNLLIPKLPAPKEEDLAKGILEAIDMDSYRVEKKAVMKIALADQDAQIEPVPTDVGGRKSEPELDRLSNILRTFNEHFGTLFADTDRVAKRIRDDIAPQVAADAAYQNAKENTPHTARMAHDQALGKVMQLLLKDDTQVYKQFVENESFRRFVGDMVYALTSP